MRRKTTQWAARPAIQLLAVLVPFVAHAQSPLGSGQFRILGAQLAVSPASQTVPKNQATGVTVSLVHPSHPAAVVATAGLGQLTVKGELSGPGLDQAQTVAVALSDQPSAVSTVLPIPALLAVGNYVLDNIRLEDGLGTTIMAGEPSVAAINVIERVIVTSVSSRPLSLEEIQDRGIVIDASNFTAYEFTFGIGTESNPVPINFDVAFPQDQEAADNEGGLTLPVAIPGLDVPNLEVKGLQLESPPLEDDTIQIPPIPAVIVIPGNIAPTAARVRDDWGEPTMTGCAGHA
jgi:hypothetical protein